MYQQSRIFYFMRYFASCCLWGKKSKSFLWELLSGFFSFFFFFPLVLIYTLCISTGRQNIYQQHRELEHLCSGLKKTTKTSQPNSSLPSLSATSPRLWNPSRDDDPPHSLGSCATASPLFGRRINFSKCLTQRDQKCCLFPGRQEWHQFCNPSASRGATCMEPKGGIKMLNPSCLHWLCLEETGQDKWVHLGLPVWYFLGFLL